MGSNIKKAANLFIKRHKIREVTYCTLKNAAENMGYTVIEFNKIFNNKDIETIVCNLDLNDAIIMSRGFTYVSKDYRLIFIDENLNDEEKLFIISHELGHIECNHFLSVPIIGKDVKEEHIANEFSHYLLNPGWFEKMKIFVSLHRKLFFFTISILCAFLCLLTVYLIVNNSDKYVDNCYITSSGECYHKKECIFVKNKKNVKKLTKSEFEKGIYKPCDLCLPDKK